MNLEKVVLAAFALLSSGSIQAQIDLDHPLQISSSDAVYRSETDPGVAYAFPKALVRLSKPFIVSEGARLKAKIDIGVDPEETAALQKALDQSEYKGLKVRYIRPLSVAVLPNSGTNLPESFHPRVTAIGDAALLAGPVSYVVEVDFANRLIGRARGLQLLDTVFGGRGMDHIATVEYQFNAFAMGAPYLGKSALPIFVGERPKLQAIAGLAESISLASDLLTGSDSMTIDVSGTCWDKPTLGAICLKELNL